MFEHESETIEFKKSTAELKEAVVSVVAILNKHGNGTLFFGVKNDGTVVGQDVNDETLRTVSQAIGHHVQPKIYPTITKEMIDEKSVVQVAFSGSQQPYLAYNIPRIRVADEDLVMEQPLYEEMLRKRNDSNFFWESRLSKYRIADVDMSVFKSYLLRAKSNGRIDFINESPDEVLTKLSLTNGDILLNAGAALFVDCPINELQMAKFASDERLTFTDIKRYTGTIFDLADKAVQYVVDAMNWRVEFEGKLQRKEIPEIPVDAIREAVMNAFAHRLIESGQSVEVAVYRSFIDVYSPGKFPDGITPEMFIKGIHKPIRRNPLITRVLYYSKDMESFATGLKRIQNLCDEANCKVAYICEDRGFTVRFFRPDDEVRSDDTNDGVNGGVGSSKETAGTGKETAGTGKETAGTGKESVGTGKEIPDQILLLVLQNPTVTVKELSQKLTLSVNGVNYHLQKLKDFGKIKRIGSTKGGHWEVVKDFE